MAELADAADLKSAALKRAWGFESPSRHQNLPICFQRFGNTFFLRAQYVPNSFPLLNIVSK
jgi:hypothetical protein